MLQRLTAPSSRSARILPWVIPLLLFLLAVLVRLPKLTTIPPPTDESDELLVALAIFRHGARPLTTSEPYLGPLWVYLIALAYTILGPSFAAGRVVAMLSSALSAPAAWALARRSGGLVAGAAAGMLMVFAFGPVVEGGHIAWSHGGAPAFMALSLAALVAATQGKPRRLWPFLAGFGGGVAVGAHPTVLTFVPGMAIWWLMADRAALLARVRASAWVLAGGVVAYAPGLFFVATHGLAPFRERATAQDYVGFSLARWPLGALAWLESLARNVAGPAMSQVADPRIWVVVLILAIAMIFSARAGQWLPLAVVVSGAVFTPLLVDGSKFTSLTGLRYAAPALPAAAWAVGLWAESYWTAGGGRRSMAALAVLGLAAVQIWSLVSYYQAVSTTGVTGEPIEAVVGGLIDPAAGPRTIFVDAGLDTKLMGGGEVSRAVRTMLTIKGVDFTLAKTDKIRWFLANGNGATYDLVLSGDGIDELSAEYALTPMRVVAIVPGQVSRSGDRWGWFRYTAARLVP